jgi:hypothetical protein
MLSISLSKEIYKEVLSDVVCRLSVGLGVSKEELYRLCEGEERRVGSVERKEFGVWKGIGRKEIGIE